MKPYHIVRNSKAYSIETVPQAKKYQLVFRKGVVDPFMSYPYGYWAALNDHNMKNVNFLMEL